MEFNEKLQELRKQKGLTQEELASQLYVSRTAISKWESGRGYPNIESLKAIARFFSVTVDELISTEEIITVAEENQKQTENHFQDIIFGLVDLCMILLFFLPLFGIKDGEFIREVSLLSFNGSLPYLKIAYFSVVIATIIMGVLRLALQNCTSIVWSKSKTKISLLLGIISEILFMISLQPYAAVFSFFFLIIKTTILVKHV